MNKKHIIEKINDKLNLNENELNIFMDIVEEIPIVGKKNKEKMITEFIDKLSIDKVTAEYYYEVFSEIITTSINDKLKHPFKNMD